MPKEKNMRRNSTANKYQSGTIFSMCNYQCAIGNYNCTLIIAELPIDCDYGFRNYDKKQRRFTSVDQLTAKYPELTTFQFASNCPISGVDLDGLEYFYSSDGKFFGKWGKDGRIFVVNSEEVEKVTAALNSEYINSFAGIKVEKEITAFESVFKKWDDISVFIDPVNNVGEKYRHKHRKFVEETDEDGNISKTWVDLSCFQASSAQMKKNGQKVGYYKHKLYNEKHKVTIDEIINGLKYIQEELKKGKLVMTGVDLKVGYDNSDNTTDHWVVVDGLGVDEYGIFLRAKDNYDKEFELTSEMPVRFYRFNVKTYVFETDEYNDGGLNGKLTSIKEGN